MGRKALVETFSVMIFVLLFYLVLIVYGFGPVKATLITAAVAYLATLALTVFVVVFAVLAANLDDFPLPDAFPVFIIALAVADLAALVALAVPIAASAASAVALAVTSVVVATVAVATVAVVTAIIVLSALVTLVAVSDLVAIDYETKNWKILLPLLVEFGSLFAAFKIWTPYLAIGLLIATLVAIIAVSVLLLREKKNITEL